MAQYEVAVLLHPDLESDLEKPLKKVEKIITDNGGKIENTDNWGKKKLAYTIAKQEHSIYIFYTVEFPAEAVSKVEGTFNITDEVIRFLITKIDQKALDKAEAIRADKAKKAEARGDKLDGEKDEE